MKLLDAGQAIVQKGVRGRAKDKEQRSDRQRGKEPNKASIRGGPPGARYGHTCQQKRQDAYVAACLHIVLDAPKDPVGGYPLPGNQVPIAVLCRIPEKVRHEESEDLAAGIGPTNHVAICDRPLAEATGHQL